MRIFYHGKENDKTAVFPKGIDFNARTYKRATKLEKPSDSKYGATSDESMG